MRVLGIDPGLRNMGWGIIDVKGNKINHTANGVCKSIGDDLATRLFCLFEQMEEVLQTWRPTQAAVENTFINKDSLPWPGFFIGKNLNDKGYKLVNYEILENIYFCEIE